MIESLTSPSVWALVRGRSEMFTIAAIPGRMTLSADAPGPDSPVRVAPTGRVAVSPAPGRVSTWSESSG